MANAPALLRMFVDAETALAEESSLGEDVRQALHLAVSQVNECGYCQAAYTAGSKAAGWSQEQTVQIRRGEVEGDDRTTALLGFAREEVAKQGWLTDATWPTTTSPTRTRSCTASVVTCCAWLPLFGTSAALRPSDGSTRPWARRCGSDPTIPSGSTSHGRGAVGAT